MSMVTVPALKPLTYQGRSYVRGDMVAMEGVDAAAAARAGDVAIDGRHVEPVRPPVRRRRTYRRRDLRAEGSRA